jgi:hypothetical protein
MIHQTVLRSGSADAARIIASEQQIKTNAAHREYDHRRSGHD